MERRQAVRLLLGLTLIPPAILRTRAAGAPAHVSVVARRFEIEPAEIAVAVNRPLVLRVATLDFPHGFTMPEFGIRVDLIPGKTVELVLTPRMPGRFHYLCDNFCGEGHDKMSGILIVSEA
jgi:cytochrome c oxidase subunit 2